MRKFSVIIEKDESGYYAFCPDLPGCQTQADSFEEAIKNIKEAISLTCGSGDYSVHRMSYRGKGGWSWPLANGPLAKLAGRFVGKIGTDAFFDLM